MFTFMEDILLGSGQLIINLSATFSKVNCRYLDQNYIDSIACKFSSSAICEWVRSRIALKDGQVSHLKCM